MSYYTRNEILYVNSHNLIAGNDTDFSIRFDIDHTVQWDKVVLLDASIPKTDYLVKTNKNTFTVDIDAVESTVTMPIGSYNRTTFARVLITQLDLIEAGVWNVTYDNQNRTEDNGKYTFSYTGVGTTVKFVISEYMYEIMGVDKNTEYTFVAGSFEAPNVMNHRPESTIYIMSNIVQNRNNSVLQNIISSGDPDFSYITFHNPNPHEYSKNFSRNKSNTYTFKIVNEDFQEYDTNGINVVFSIMLYKTEDISHMIANYIKFRLIKEQERDEDQKIE